VDLLKNFLGPIFEIFKIFNHYLLYNLKLLSWVEATDPRRSITERGWLCFVNNIKLSIT